MWYLYSPKLKISFSALALLVMFTAIPALSQAPVEVNVSLKGDLLLLDASTKGAEPSLRMNPEPAYLELTFPNSKLSGNAFSKAIDKGLIQKVVTGESSGNATARIFVLSKPKASLSKTESGFRYTIRVNDMAGAPKRVEPTTSTSAPAPATAPVAVKPVETPKPAPAKPAAKPPASQNPAASPPPASQKPAVSPPPSTATKPQMKGPSAPVTVVFNNTPLNKAVAQMAVQAGLKSTVDTTLTGTVTRSFTGIPFETALRNVLEPFGDGVETTYANDNVTVRPKVSAAGSSKSPTPPAASPTRPPVATPPVASPEPPPTATARVVREYFPFKSKSAEKAKQAAQLAFPNITYLVDPILNVLMVEGSAQEIDELEKFLRAQSPK